MLGFKNRPRWLGRLPELDAEIVVEEIPGEFDAEEHRYSEILPAAGSLEEFLAQNTINDKALIERLEGDLAEAFRLLAWQGQTIAAARAFVELVGSTYVKTGEPVFKTTQGEDSLVAETLNHRFSDLAALLNQGTRPVPPKLAQGTVH
jgi:hypothetical protein